jgi:hypothetical protein
VAFVCATGLSGAYGFDSTSTVSGPQGRTEREWAWTGLDPAGVSTGILHEGVTPFSEVELFDGTADAPITTQKNWQQMYHEIYHRAVEPLPWPGIVDLRRQAQQRSKDGVIPIAMLNVLYNRLVQEDLEPESRSRPQGGLSPYSMDGLLVKRLFAAAALGQQTHRGSYFKFVFDSAFYFSNAGPRLPRLQVDFDDGRGLVAVAFDQPVAITYGSAGCKVVKVEARYNENLHLCGEFYFEVDGRQAPPPHETWNVVAEIPYEGGYGSGQAYVYLSDAHTELTYPALFIEGFDIDNSMNWDELYERMNEENLLETLRSGGIDFVVINFDDSTDYIQRHAFLTVAVIEQIKQRISPATPIMVAGASMGGLVGRYTLAYMEQNGLDHRVSTFISFDSPQKGANIPLGLQYWVDFFAVESAEAAFMRDALNSPSARQMLLYQFAASPPGGAGSDPLRAVLEAELLALGDYPVNVRKVSIANGSGNQMDQGYAAGDQLILYEYESFLVDIIGNVWAVPYGTGQIIFDGLIDRIWPLPDDQRTVFVSGTLPLDNAPGGSRPSMAQLEATPVPYGDLIALHDSHCFIPTISSLDIDTDDLFYFIASDPNIMDLTPFDAIYYPMENQEHNIVTPENAAWFIAEIQGVFSPVVEGSDPVPSSLVVLQNYPNPFNPATRIPYQLGADALVTLEIFDLQGKIQRTLLEEQERPQGLHVETWHGCDDQGRLLPSGVYVYRLSVGEEVRSRRMLLVR